MCSQYTLFFIGRQDDKQTVIIRVLMRFKYEKKREKQASKAIPTTSIVFRKTAEKKHCLGGIIFF
ncbi:hypothetical protein GMOD_00004185 [Pyrenophora seminiperda CCB06]|uniref:Uncharacterized protein n=1 Tax=Pyrenophora seminiperda CCB06 TaxID=1302712 RepID=A0A3M7M0U7_9PLEO|nr:hypothetical protein GMOD_00004185 [Pyrenophora seminiperda CCB06]